MGLNRNKRSRKQLLIFFFFIINISSSFAQGTLIDFSSIPKSGTVLIYAHMDDDLIWMLPFWKITETFMGGAMPATPSYKTLVSQQQTFLNNNGYNIDYESNWITPWSDITNTEYDQYYWRADPAYNYLVNDHLETRSSNSKIDLSSYEINKIKAKLEQYFALPGNTRFITHNNWGEYGHKHHLGLNKAVRELAVKYRKDVWMLGCDNDEFRDIIVPNGITYTMGSFNTPDLFTGIRTIYRNNGLWTWVDNVVPAGDHKFIKIVDKGSDKSNILTGQSITVSGPPQMEPGSYIFDGNDDYLTLKGNNYSSFTISMRIRPDQIEAMDISTMSEYPSSSKHDRNLYLDIDGHVTARIFDGSSKVVTSTTAVSAATWSYIAISSNGRNLKLYINGILEKTISTEKAITNYSTPEFILGQATETGSYFTGQISDVRLYDHALTDSQIAGISGMVYTITTSAGSGGSINPSGTSNVSIGTNKTYIIIPWTGFGICDVKADNVSVGAVSTYTFNNITSNHSISAVFDTASYSITGSAGDGGSISPSGIITELHGADRTYTITPGIGYSVSDVRVDNVSAGAITSYTFNNITSNHTISATFEVSTYSLSAIAGSGGLITPSGNLKVNYGANRTYSVTPNVGYNISDVKIDEISAGPISTYLFNNITNNHTIAASFEHITYTINDNAGDGGSISTEVKGAINYGSNSTYLITPKTGYNISDVTVDNISMGNVASFTFNNVTSNHRISATFTPITYTLTARTDKGGSISSSGTVNVNYGTNQAYIITPDAGYQIADVTVDGLSVGEIPAYTFTKVAESHSISASFKVITYIISGSVTSGGSISPAGVVPVNYGSDLTYTISADSAYRVIDVEVDGKSVEPVTSYSFNDVIANHTISVTLEPIETHTIYALAGIGGSISPTGTMSLFEGSDQTYTITPASGYRIFAVIVDNLQVDVTSDYTFRNLGSDHDISAVFVKNIDIDVYPNPFQEEFEIKIASPDEKLFDISIADINGRIIYTRSKISGNTITPVNLRVFPGLYTIRVYCNGKRIAVIKTIKS